MRHYCLALDLKDDKILIAEYENYHRNVWPEILAKYQRCRHCTHGNLQNR